MVVIDFGKFQLNNQVGSENQEAGNKARNPSFEFFFLRRIFWKIIFSTISEVCSLNVTII